MKKIETDILVVGAGLSGLMSAYCLSELNISISIVDHFDFTDIESRRKDLRTTAISEGSKQFLDHIGIWKKIQKYSEPIKNIKVLDRKVSRSIEFSNPANKENLGYIVKNSDIKFILLKELNKKPNIRFFKNHMLLKIAYKTPGVLCQFENFEINSKLIIGADGKNSIVRKLLQTPVYKKQYDQKAIVINIEHTKNHFSTAFELFYNTGPLAILPMKKIKKNKFLSSLIWSHNSDFIKSISQINKNFLKELLEESINSFVGEITQINSVQSFDLSAHINKRFYEKQVVYLGDAAHSIHPIAGQGWNIGIRDIKNLLEVSKNNLKLGLELGSNTYCKEYNDKTFYDAFVLFQLTDKLNSVFLSDRFLINRFRSTGFKIINKNLPIKNHISNFAMGFN